MGEGKGPKSRALNARIKRLGFRLPAVGTRGTFEQSGDTACPDQECGSHTDDRSGEGEAA